MEDQKALFEDWADSYDKDVLESQNTFPFKGYSELVDEIVKIVEPNSTILDLGIGTGYISNKLHTEKSCQIYGIDLSEKMIEISKNRIQESVIIQFDFDNYLKLDWSLFSKKIDYFIGTYFFHHYSDEDKINIIEFLLSKVSPSAKILIGDIGFLNNELLLENKKRLKNEWDESEYYFDLVTTQKTLESKGLKVQSKVVSEYCILIEIWK